MSESDYWNRVKPMLFGWDPVRIENSAGLGTPDVNHIHGWLELKWIPDWPRRPETVVRLDHYTPEQRAWHMRRTHAGGRVHVLLGVGGASLLLWGDVAAQHLGRVPRGELLDLTVAAWPRGSKAMRKELKDAILQDRPDRQRGLFDSR